DSPWNNTHDQLRTQIGAVSDVNTQETLFAFFEAISILNTKMLNIFGALQGFAPVFTPEFNELLKLQKSVVLGGDPTSGDEAAFVARPGAPAAVAAPLRGQGRSRYQGYLTRATPTAVAALTAAVEALRVPAGA